MLFSNRYAAAILATKPSGMLLANFPLTGLPQPDFNDALKRDGVERLFSSLITLGEALADIKAKRSTWPTAKLYYSSFYSFESVLAFDEITKFYIGKQHYVGDPRSGTIRKAGTSSHDLNWAVFSNFPRLTRWVYSQDSGDTYNRLKEYRVEANYRSPFRDPIMRPEWDKINTSRLENTFRAYKEDDTFNYTFLSDHCALAYPIRIAKEAWSLMVAQKLDFDPSQKSQLTKVWPFLVEFFAS